MPSTSYSAMVVRLRELRARLLPSRFDKLGKYSDTQRERARAYRLLAHAEVEQYLEDIAVAVAQRATADWQASRTPSVASMALIMTALREVKKMPAEDRSGLDDVVRAGNAQLNSYAKDSNHGVKKRNLVNLFAPVGIDVPTLFPVLTVGLDSWGGRRGHFAHSGGYIQLVNPEDEYNLVKSLVRELRQLDKLAT